MMVSIRTRDGYGWFIKAADREKIYNRIMDIGYNHFEAADVAAWAAGAADGDSYRLNDYVRIEIVR